MKKTILILAATAALISIPFAASAADSNKVNKAFGKADKNSDGKISKEEFVAAAGKRSDSAKAETVFARKDKNKDGFLTADEFKAADTEKKDGDTATTERRGRRKKAAN